MKWLYAVRHPDGMLITGTVESDPGIAVEKITPHVQRRWSLYVEAGFRVVRLYPRPDDIEVVDYPEEDEDV